MVIIRFALKNIYMIIGKKGGGGYMLMGLWIFYVVWGGGGWVGLFFFDWGFLVF